MATAKAKKADKNAAPAQAPIGPTTEDLQNDGALAGGDPAFADAEGTDTAPAETGTAESTAEEDSQAADQEQPAPAQVKVKMKTTSSGPLPKDNWREGSIRFVSRAEADALLADKLADELV